MPSDYSSEQTPLDSQTDTELFFALKNGQIEALGILYDRHADSVYGLALRLLANSQEAEDLTQEVFLILYHRDTYDPARGSLISFLLVITRSRATDRLRSHGIKLRFLQRWRRSQTPRDSFTPIDQASRQEQAAAIREAMALLPEAERQVLEIAYYEGMSHSAIAKRLNIPLGTVKSRSRQGLKKLRQSLQDLVE